MKSSLVRLSAAVLFCLALLAAAVARPLSVRNQVSRFEQGEPATRVLELGQAALPALIERALAPDCVNRERVVELLRHTAPQVAYQAFTGTLKGYRPGCRTCAAHALGILGDPGARPYLELAAGSEEPSLARAAAQALERLEGSPK